MHLIVCVSDAMGTSFNERRVSRDAVICQDILKISAGHRLYMHPYSKTIFPDADDRIIFDDEYLSKADAGDFCFYEKGDLCGANKIADTIMIYNWNRNYPADTFFTFDESQFECTEEIAIAGKSHPDVIRKTYKRRKLT